MREKRLSYYEISLRGYEKHSSIIIAETAGKAKYRLWLRTDRLFDNFFNFLRNISYCRRIYTLPTEEERMRVAFEMFKAHRGIRFAKIGMKVQVCGKNGTIVGCTEPSTLEILYDDGTRGICHPTYNIRYFDDCGKLIAAYPSKAS